MQNHDDIENKHDDVSKEADCSSKQYAGRDEKLLGSVVDSGRNSDVNESSQPLNSGVNDSSQPLSTVDEVTLRYGNIENDIPESRANIET